jgi:hypothetical protein
MGSFSSPNRPKAGKGVADTQREREHVSKMLGRFTAPAAGADELMTAEAKGPVQ